MAEIDLSKFFRKEAPKLRNQIRNNIKRKRGWRGDPAPHNSPVTVQIKGKDHWLVDTGELMNKGIKYDSHKLGMSLYASDQRHTNSEDTYSEIFDAYSRRYSGAFGIKDNDPLFQRMEYTAWKQAFEVLQKDLPSILKMRL